MPVPTATVRRQSVCPSISRERIDLQGHVNDGVTVQAPLAVSTYARRNE